MKNIANFYFLNKIPIIRVDFNVQQNNIFRVLDKTRIIETIATIYKIIIYDRVQKTILIYQLGSAHGEISLIKIISYMQKALKIQVHFCKEILGKIIHRNLYSLNKEILILIIENYRFFKEEDVKEVFEKQIGDIYVNDAFGVSHRYQTTITKRTKFFPSLKFFGFFLKEEFKEKKFLVIYGKKTITAILGGAKVLDKRDLLVNIPPLRDQLFIEGVMAYILEGRRGNSIIDYYKKKVHVYFPIDVIIDPNIKEAEEIEKKIFWMGLDIGRKTILMFTKVINRSLSIFLNGPLGVFELSILKPIKNVISMVGGGDSILSRKKDKISPLSTGRCVMLAILKGKIIPSVESIVNN